LKEKKDNLIYLCPKKLGPPPHGGIFDGPSLSRTAGVRDIWLCLGVLCLKSQIPNTKKQTSSKLQAPRQKDGGQANSKEIPNYKHQISRKFQSLLF
jgi:hypothetical protein